jgi:hypothetical protein
VTNARLALLDADTWLAMDTAGVIWKTTTGGR